MHTEQPAPSLPMSSSSAGSGANEVDASVWRSVAGASVRIPAVHSYVYYFPQGHLEHFSSAAAVVNYSFSLKCSMIPCQVLSVRFLCNPNSDQAFVKILLQPLQPLGPRPEVNGENEDENNQNEVVSFAKVLTLSDANNGGGFSVPRFCADMIFPRLDFAADPPVQNLTLIDTHNNAWEFRHIYRGTPRRHLLTTGWSKFVNAKRLIAGDSVVFMKKKLTGDLFIGVRRYQRFGDDDGRDIGEVVEAIKNAGKGMAFEVVYYPRVGLPDFVVKAEKVKDALRTCWSAGMRVRMAVDSEDGSRMTWFQGKITAATSPNSGPWCGSPWRMLQVTWDEPESLHNANRVSPWQVECVYSSPLFDPEFHTMKKLKVLQNPESQHCFPMIEFSHSMAGQLNSALFNYSPFPAGVQGARPDLCISNANIGRPDLCISNANSDRPDLSISNANSDTLNQTVKQIPKNSFQLFGKTIQMAEPDEGGSKSNSGCTDG